MREVQKEAEYRQIAKELGLTTKVVREIIESEFRFVSDKMSTQLDRGVRLPYFGRFFPDPYRVKKMLEGRAKKNGLQ